MLIVSIPNRDLMNLEQSGVGSASVGGVVSIPNRDLMNLEQHIERYQIICKKGFNP